MSEPSTQLSITEFMTEKNKLPKIKLELVDKEKKIKLEFEDKEKGEKYVKIKNL